MIAQDPNPSPNSLTTVINTVPVGSYAPVFRSGDAYKAVGELVQRSVYTALSAAFPRNGSVSSILGGAVPSSSVYYTAIAFGNGLFVAVGNGTSVSGSPQSNAAMYTNDPKKDMLVAILPSVGYWTCIAYGAGKFVALGYNATTADPTTPTQSLCATSSDGVNWTARTIPGTACWNSIAWNGSMFAAVATSTSTTGVTTVGASSPDGINWTARTMPTSAPWAAVCANTAGLFVAVAGNSAAGSTAAATSPDGITWTARTIPLSGWTGVAYGNGVFVAVSNYIAGFATGIATSPDGITWTARTPYSVRFATRICFGNGVFVATLAGSVITSSDGITWSQSATAVGSIVWAIAYDGAGSFALMPYGGSSDPSPKMKIVYAENTTDSDYLYLSGTAGQYIRVK